MSKFKKSWTHYLSKLHQYLLKIPFLPTKQNSSFTPQDSFQETDHRIAMKTNLSSVQAAAIPYLKNLFHPTKHNQSLEQAIEIYTQAQQWHPALLLRLLKLMDCYDLSQELNSSNFCYAQNVKQSLLRAQDRIQNIHKSLILADQEITKQDDFLAAQWQQDQLLLDEWELAISLLKFQNKHPLFIDTAFNAWICAILRAPDQDWNKLAFSFLGIVQNQRHNSDFQWSKSLIQVFSYLVQSDPDVKSKVINYAEILIRSGRRTDALAQFRYATELSLKKNSPSLLLQVQQPPYVKPSFAIVGTKKSGTTSLYEYIIQSSYVVPAAYKEIDYWSWRFGRGQDWFLAHFPKVSAMSSMIMGDASPTYFQHSLAPQRMYKFSKEFKAIIVLRNPINRAISQYFHDKKSGISPLPLEATLINDLQAVKKGEYNPEMMNNLIASSLYVDHVKRWLEVLSPDNVLVLIAEDFYCQPEAVLQRVFHFLGIPSIKNLDLTPHNVGNYQYQSQGLEEDLLNFFEPSIRELEELCNFKTSWL